MKILVINGPNLNMLGIREPEIYGTTHYADLVEKLLDYAVHLEVAIEVLQTNHEGQIIDWLQQISFDGLVINPGGYTHTSVAILDALLYCDKPKVEVHLSDISKREAFRQTSITGRGVDHIIMGEGIAGYCRAFDYIVAATR
ncbi:MAG: 3-dehydroquinate dehydratase [Clostridiales bacterium]|nr:MAG: 3-dehydroquinate dehydratase [Clostridiales bacterium]